MPPPEPSKASRVRPKKCNIAKAQDRHFKIAIMKKYLKTLKGYEIMKSIKIETNSAMKLRKQFKT